MSDKYQLHGLGDDELVAALPALVKHDNQQLAVLLAHLGELEARKLYLDMGFRSMFEYCTLQLGFCEPTAGRRIAVAQLCRRFPEAFERLARGGLHLSALSMLARYVTPANATDLFDACTRKTAREVERILAVRFPRHDVPDSIRRKPRRAGGPTESARAEPTANAVEEPERNPLADSGTINVESDGSGKRTIDATGSAEPSAEKSVNEPGSTSNRQPARIEPLASDRFAVHFTADAELIELLEQVRALESHRNAQGELCVLFKAALEAYRRELLKTRFSVGVKARAKSGANDVADDPYSPKERRGSRERRKVPAAVARAVYLRDGGRCTFIAKDGRRCSARRFLQLDHIDAWALGGPETEQNLRMRCSAHNQRHAEQVFGAEHMQQALNRAGARRRE